MNQPSPARASCLCGAVRLDARLPSKWVAHCHCTRCQRAHGAPVVTWAGFEADQVTIVDPQAQLKWFVAPEGGSRAFCGACGSPMVFKSDRWPGELHLARALFTTPLDREPQVHAYFETHVSWLAYDDGLPRQDSTAA